MRKIFLIIFLCFFSSVNFLYAKDLIYDSGEVDISTIRKMYERQIESLEKNYENKLTESRKTHRREKEKILSEQKEEIEKLRQKFNKIKKREISYQNILYNPSNLEIIGSFDDKILMKHFTESSEKNILLSANDVFLYSGMPFKLSRIDKGEKIVFDLLEGQIDKFGVRLNRVEKVNSDEHIEDIIVTPRLIVFFNKLDGSINFKNEKENLEDMINQDLSNLDLNGDEVNLQEIRELLKDGQDK